MVTFTDNELTLIDYLIGHEYSPGNGDIEPYLDMVKSGDFTELTAESHTWWWPDEVAQDLEWSGFKLGGVVSSLIEKDVVSVMFVSRRERELGDDDSILIKSGDAVTAWASWPNRRNNKERS